MEIGSRWGSSSHRLIIIAPSQEANKGINGYLFYHIFKRNGMMSILIRIASSRAILKSNLDIHFLITYENFPKICLNVRFLKLPEDFPGDSKTSSNQPWHTSHRCLSR